MDLTRRDFGKGISAILAAGYAPSLLGASGGGLMRGVAARLGMVSGGGKKDYIQDGLVFHQSFAASSSNRTIDVEAIMPVGGTEMSIEFCVIDSANGGNNVGALIGETGLWISSIGYYRNNGGGRIRSILLTNRWYTSVPTSEVPSSSEFAGTIGYATHYAASGNQSAYINGVTKHEITASNPSPMKKLALGANVEFTDIRIYSRYLSADEFAYNHTVDQQNFGVP